MQNFFKKKSNQRIHRQSADSQGRYYFIKSGGKKEPRFRFPDFFAGLDSKKFLKSVFPTSQEFLDFNT